MEKNLFTDKLRKIRTPLTIYKDSILHSLREGYSLAEIYRVMKDDHGLSIQYDSFRKQVKKWQTPLKSPPALTPSSQVEETKLTSTSEPKPETKRDWDLSNWNGQQLPDEELY